MEDLLEDIENMIAEAEESLETLRSDNPSPQEVLAFFEALHSIEGMRIVRDHIKKKAGF